MKGFSCQLATLHVCHVIVSIRETAGQHRKLSGNLFPSHQIVDRHHCIINLQCSRNHEITMYVLVVYKKGVMAINYGLAVA